MSDRLPEPGGGVGGPALHLVFLIGSLGQGGAERMAALWSNHWASLGWRVTLVSFDRAVPDAFVLDPRVGRIRVSLPGRSAGQRRIPGVQLYRLVWLHRLAGRLAPDVMLGFLPAMTMLIGLLPARAGMVRIGAERGDPAGWKPGRVTGLLYRYACARLDALTVQTARGARWLERHRRCRRVVVIGNPVLLPIPRGEPVVLPREVIAADRRVLLAAGRLNHQKGFDRLIEAFAGLAAALPGWDLVIVGEGEERPALENQVRRAGLAERVRLPGFVGNAEDWYRRCDLFVLSSRFEGMPNALLEAMACGAAVVSMDCPTGPGELVTDGVDGVLVPDGQWGALAEALRGLMADAGLRGRLGRAACRVRDRHSMAEVHREWEALFRNAGSREPDARNPVAG